MSEEPRTDDSAHALLDACWMVLTEAYGSLAVESSIPHSTLDRLIENTLHFARCCNALELVAITPELAAKVCGFEIPPDSRPSPPGNEEPRTKNQERS